jgi:hypothetical protein
LFGIMSQNPARRPDARTTRTYRALSAAMARDMDDRFHELVWRGLSDSRSRSG